MNVATKAAVAECMVLGNNERMTALVTAIGLYLVEEVI